MLAQSTDLRSISDLAQRIGMNQSNLSKVLKKHAPPSPKMLRELAQALRCATTDLWPAEDFSGGAAPYPAWTQFRLGTDLGRSMNDEESADLARIRFLHREPTVPLYESILLLYRAYASKGDGAPPSAVSA